MAMARASLAHLGIFVWDLAVMERFYTEVFGMVVTDRGVGAVFRNDLVFMTGSADQHHQLVLASGRQPGAASTVMQISFKIDSLADLRDLRDNAVAGGATDAMGLNHGNAWSVYFNDPEANRVEIYLDTPFHTPQPCGEPLNLDISEAELLEETRLLVGGLSGSKPRSDYVTEMEGRLGH